MEPLDSTALQRLAHDLLHVRELVRTSAGVYRHPLAVSRRRFRSTRIVEPYFWPQPVLRPPSSGRSSRGHTAKNSRNHAVPKALAGVRRTRAKDAQAISLPTAFRGTLETLLTQNRRKKTSYRWQRGNIGTRHKTSRLYRLKVCPVFRARTAGYKRNPVVALRAIHFGMRSGHPVAVRATKPGHRGLTAPFGKTAVFVRQTNLTVARSPVAPLSERRVPEPQLQRQVWPHGSGRPAPEPSASVQPTQQDLEETGLGRRMVEYLERQMLRPRRGMTGVDPRVMPF